jgi:hypothetical protein
VNLNFSDFPVLTDLEYLPASEEPFLSLVIS